LTSLHVFQWRSIFVGKDIFVAAATSPKVTASGADMECIQVDQQ
jgi:hypothetical protein